MPRELTTIAIITSVEVLLLLVVVVVVLLLLVVVGFSTVTKELAIIVSLLIVVVWKNRKELNKFFIAILYDGEWIDIYDARTRKIRYDFYVNKFSIKIQTYII